MRSYPALFARLLAWIVAFAGLAVLCAWYSGHLAWTTLLPGLNPMKPNTALCFVMAGVSLAVNLGRNGPTAGRWSFGAVVLAAAVAAVAAANLLEHLCGWNLGLDELVFRDSITDPAVSVPGRMSIAAAIAFLALSGALICLQVRTEGAAYAVQSLAFIALIDALLACVAYVYGVHGLYAVNVYCSIAVHTSVLLLLLSGAVLFARSDEGFVAVFFSPHGGGQMSRLMLPLAATLPFFFGWLQLKGQEAGWYGTEFGLALFATSNIVLFICLLWSSARVLNARSEALTTSDRRFRLLAETMPQIVWTTAPNGSVNYFNSRWYEYTGMTPEQSKDWGWQPVLHPDDLANCLKRWDTALKTGGGYEVEYRFKRASDGAYRWQLGRAFPVRDAQGKILQWVGTCTDIEEQKRANELLRQRVAERTAEARAAQARLQAVLDAATQLSIIATDTQGLITVFNRGAEAMLGYTAEELVGKRTPEIIHLRSEVEARGAELSQELGREIRGFDVFVEKSRSGGFEERQWTYVRKDGSHRLVDLVVTSCGDEQGGITGFLGVAKDVTERRRGEEALRLSEERFSNIFNFANTGMALYSPDGRWLKVNEALCEILGYREEELIGRDYRDFTHPDDIEASADHVRRLLAGEYQSYKLEKRYLHKQGHAVWVLVGVTLQRDAGGQPLYAIGHVENITEMKAALQRQQELAERAQAAERCKSDFLANMSHEVRTPMNGILGLSSLVLETDLKGNQRHMVQTIRSSAESLLCVINDVLDFAKIEAGKMQIDEIPFDLRQVVEDSLEVMSGIALGKDIELIGCIAPGTETQVVGDPSRVRQVLLNLLSNAVKFTKRGEVCLEVNNEAIDDGTVTLHFCVRDTGLGMSGDQQARLFQPFMQADSSTARGYGGTGLGLVISKHLVEAMNGTIGVTSSVGKGSEFWFVLRLQRQMRPAESCEVVAPLRDLRVLLFDSNKTRQTFLQHKLELWEMRVTIAETVDEARRLLERAMVAGDAIDLVLADSSAPHGHGMELARMLDESATSRKPRVVLLAHLGDYAETAEMPRCVVATCLKPVRRASLLAALSQALRPASARNIFTQEPAPRAEAPARLERILLAEDNPVNQEVALLNLRKLGFSADVVQNGLEVLEVTAAKDYDIILMDCQMPEMDGYQAARELRKRAESGAYRSRIIAITANAMSGEREKCLAAGMDDYLTKPFHRNELKAVLDRVPPRLSAGSSKSALEVLSEDGRESFAHLVKLFEQTGDACIEAMEAALEAGDSAALARVAHKLKGSAASMGAGDLREICSRIELAASCDTPENSTELMAHAKRAFLGQVDSLERYAEAHAW